MYQKSGNSNHLDYALSLNNIGNILVDQGIYDETLEFQDQALKVRQTMLSSDHSDIACSHNNIGDILHKQGKYSSTSLQGSGNSKKISIGQSSKDSQQSK